jgi:GntR family transcriptional regulator / MocR family aminotransferase
VPDLHITVDPAEGELSRQIYRDVRMAIITGRVRRGDRLPATRDLARRLDVSRNTVALAFEWLVAEGLVSGRRGAGTFVEGDPTQRETRTGGAPIRHRAIWDSIALPAARPAFRYDFTVGSPDARLFPYEDWRRVLARQIRATKLGASYGDPAGHPGLREAIARYVAASRGVQATADDVIVTNGAQHAFDLIARVLIDRGDRIAVEDPGYPPPRLLFASLGARVKAVRVDDEGLDVAALPDDARIVYVTPSHQFPLGMPMSYARRIALLDWAQRRNAVIIEDDYDSEFRFGGRPLDTLQAIDRNGRVIYTGSFSKSLLPSLRLGFLIAPPSLRRVFAAASYVSSWYPQLPAQLAMASLINDGLLARHVRKMRREYAARHERILATLTRDFAAWLDPIPSVTGMHLAARLRVRNEASIAERAAASGVGFDRLSNYYVGRAKPGIVLGYGGIATNDIDEGLRRLRRAIGVSTGSGTRA